MPEALVRGVRINYEVIGDHGPWIALTPGSRRSFGELTDLSKAIAASGYRVLLHDRRNCGASDVAFDGSGSEHEVWADDLYALGKELGALPMYVGGSSAGARLAILYALRHADGLRGLVLWRVTGKLIVSVEARPGGRSAMLHSCLPASSGTAEPMASSARLSVAVPWASVAVSSAR